MREIPCGHLNEAGPFCEMGRDFPQDCRKCASYSPGLNANERTRCEVWTRVMGYHRPVSQFNAGKRQEHKDRRYFVETPGDLNAHETA